MSDARYVRATGRFAPTALYDPLVALTMREGAWRPRLVARAETGDVVDVGCGTGTLAIALARAGARVTGVDGDDDVLARARAKAGPSLPIDWRRGLADALPLEDAGADVVVMSLLLHHLAPGAKAAALREAHRVLRPGGRLLVADWGRAADPLQRALLGVLQVFDGVGNIRDHAAGRLPDMIRAAGFEPMVFDRLRTGWGTLELIDAARA